VIPTTDEVRCTVLDGVATVVLHRPDVLNAITPTMLEALVATLDALTADETVRVVVLTGAGRAFSAGVDLKALAGRSLEGGSVGDVLDVPARRAIALLTTMPKIVVAKVNGHCFTGALELALACDLVIVAAEAKLADTHAKFGLRPTWGMSQRLPRLVGVARARELSYTARTFTGTEAALWGMALRAVPAAELDAAVDELVAVLLANSAGALAAAKDLARAALDHPLADGLRYEAAAVYRIDDTEARVAGFR
jgi:enoyl-CoA hydratase/carnithine racemase